MQDNLSVSMHRNKQRDNQRRRDNFTRLSVVLPRKLQACAMGYGDA